jgi:hypothetical protein
MKNLIKVAALVVAFIIAVGSVGAVDTGSIGMIQCFIQCGICAVISYFILKSFKGENTNE